jgi:glycerol-3-phosphate acyltransferase PlsX
MAIILDAMGSDTYPLPEIEGALKAAEDLKIEVILVGKKDLIEPILNQKNTTHLPVTIEDAPDVLEMTDKPVEAAKKKPKNSMAVGLDLIKSGQGSAFVTAGNTGGAMFNALRKLGRIKGVQRPALTAIFPVKNGTSVVLDIGANADCRPDFFIQFAIMGSIYAEKALHRSNPKVALLANGEEDMKGNQLVKDAHQLLKNAPVNFTGNIEPKELFKGEADVIITDGFTGNILLKTSEAVAKMITDILKEELLSSLRTKIGAALAKPAFAKIKKTMDPGEIGAAPLLGIDGLVFVGHGRSDGYAIFNAIKAAHQAVEANLMDALRSGIEAQLSE